MGHVTCSTSKQTMLFYLAAAERLSALCMNTAQMVVITGCTCSRQHASSEQDVAGEGHCDLQLPCAALRGLPVGNSTSESADDPG